MKSESVHGDPIEQLSMSCVNQKSSHESKKKKSIILKCSRKLDLRLFAVFVCLFFFSYRLHSNKPNRVKRVVSNVLDKKRFEQLKKIERKHFFVLPVCFLPKKGLQALCTRNLSYHFSIAFPNIFAFTRCSERSFTNDVQSDFKVIDQPRCDHRPTIICLHLLFILPNTYSRLHSIAFHSNQFVFLFTVFDPSCSFAGFISGHVCTSFAACRFEKLMLKSEKSATKVGRSRRNRLISNYNLNLTKNRLLLAKR